MIKVVTSLICDRCQKEEYPVTDRDKQSVLVREQAHKDGWVTMRGEGMLMDICSECQGESEKE